jgi:hypothetical protein
VIHAALTRASMFDLVGYPELRAADLTFGALLGTVELIECEEASIDEWEWHLANPQRFASPVLWKGKLGLWDAPAEAIAAQLPAQ